MSAAFLDSISPWASRASTPKPGQAKADKVDERLSPSGISQQQQGGDHRISHRHRLSLKNYPEDCPPVNIRWFYAVDVRFSVCMHYNAILTSINTGTETKTIFTIQTLRAGQTSSPAEEIRCLFCP